MGDVLNVTYSVLLLFGIASGLGLIFGLMRVINFAHGEFVMLGAYVALWISQRGGFWYALVAAPLLVAALSLVIEFGLMRRLYRRPLETILATWGLSIVIRQAMKLLVGARFRSIANPLPGSVSIFGASYPTYRIVVMVLIVLVIGSLLVLMRFTRLGILARAVVENPELASGLGINVNRVYQATFAMGAALAAFAGVLVGPSVSVHPEMGPAFVVGSFLAVLAGGGGSLSGLAASAVVLGTSQSLVVRWFGPTAGTLVIVILAVFLMRVRPQGLIQRSHA